MFTTLYLKRLGKISFKTNYCNQGSSFEEREWAQLYEYNKDKQGFTVGKIEGRVDRTH